MATIVGNDDLIMVSTVSIDHLAVADSEIHLCYTLSDLLSGIEKHVMTWTCHVMSSHQYSVMISTKQTPVVMLTTSS